MLDEKDIKIETMRGHGNGGQNRNKIESAVRVTHLPTGITAYCQDQRDQNQNKKAALATLEERVTKIVRARKHFALNEARREQHSSGRVRTYDLHKNLVTDHRRGTKTTRVQDVLDGRLELLEV